MEKAEQVEIREDFIKLDSFLKLAGALNSGGKAKFEILAGEVLLNGAVCTERGKKLRSGDRVSYAGKTYEVLKK